MPSRRRNKKVGSWVNQTTGTSWGSQTYTSWGRPNFTAQNTPTAVIPTIKSRVRSFLSTLYLDSEQSYCRLYSHVQLWLEAHLRNHFTAIDSDDRWEEILGWRPQHTVETAREMASRVPRFNLPHPSWFSGSGGYAVTTWAALGGNLEPVSSPPHPPPAATSPHPTPMPSFSGGYLSAALATNSRNTVSYFDAILERAAGFAPGTPSNSAGVPVSTGSLQDRELAESILGRPGPLREREWALNILGRQGPTDLPRQRVPETLTFGSFTPGAAGGFPPELPPRPPYDSTQSPTVPYRGVQRATTLAPQISSASAHASVPPPLISLGPVTVSSLYSRVLGGNTHARHPYAAPSLPASLQSQSPAPPTSTFRHPGPPRALPIVNPSTRVPPLAPVTSLPTSRALDAYSHPIPPPRSPTPPRNPHQLAEEASILLEVFSQSSDADTTNQAHNRQAISTVLANVNKIWEVLSAEGKGKEPANSPGVGGEVLPSRSDDQDPALMVYSGCVICYNAVADTVLMPCHHLVLCMECSDGMGVKHSPNGFRGSQSGETVRCPLCRAVVNYRIKIFRG